MVARNEIYWSDLGPPAGRRPVCVLSRDAAAAILNSVVCAPITRTIRGIRSEVEVGPEHGLPEPGAINCDHLVSVPLSRLDPAPVGRLNDAARVDLDRALRYSLNILF